MVSARGGAIDEVGEGVGAMAEASDPVIPVLQCQSSTIAECKARTLSLRVAARRAINRAANVQPRRRKRKERPDTSHMEHISPQKTT